LNSLINQALASLPPGVAERFERRRHAQTVVYDKQKMLKRIQMKIIMASEKMGYVSAPGTQAVLRCKGLVLYRRTHAVKALVN
jgi:hypothetical protein